MREGDWDATIGASGVTAAVTGGEEGEADIGVCGVADAGRELVA
jgi:hypothetical protein